MSAASDLPNKLWKWDPEGSKCFLLSQNEAQDNLARWEIPSTQQGKNQKIWHPVRLSGKYDP